MPELLEHVACQESVWIDRSTWRKPRGDWRKKTLRAFAVLQQMQTGTLPYYKKGRRRDAGCHGPDRPLVDAQALVRDLFKLMDEILLIMKEKQSHPVIEQMVKPDVRDDLPASEFEKATSVSSSSGQSRLTRNPTQPKEHVRARCLSAGLRS